MVSPFDTFLLSLPESLVRSFTAFLALPWNCRLQSSAAKFVACVVPCVRLCLGGWARSGIERRLTTRVTDALMSSSYADWRTLISWIYRLSTSHQQAHNIEA